jgi:hypothetical protein
VALALALHAAQRLLTRQVAFTPLGRGRVSASSAMAAFVGQAGRQV